MKRALVTLARKFGLAVIHDSPDPLLRDLLTTHGFLRLNADVPARCDDALARFAFNYKLRHLLRHFAIDLVIDIGANRGQFAQSLRRLGYAGDIVSFEPISAHLQELAELARRDGRWRVQSCAIGAAAATLPLTVYAASTFSSFHRLNATGAAEFGSSTEIDHVADVPVVTLDSLWGEITAGKQRRVLIKSDTQGHERDVILGARRALAASAVLLAEVSIMPIYEGTAGFDEVRTLLAREHYAVSALIPICTRGADLALVEMDCFFVRTPPPGTVSIPGDTSNPQ